MMHRRPRPHRRELATAARSEHALRLANVAEELIGETAWVSEREEMAAWELVDMNLQSLLCDATLELDRKEPIVASGNHADPGRRPPVESSGLAEQDIGFQPLPHLDLLYHVGPQ